MVKRIIETVIAFVSLFTCGLCLSGCGRMDNYLAVIPGDQDYKATLNYHVQATNGEHNRTWVVIQKSATICEQERNVIYIEYSFEDANTPSYNFALTLLYVQGKVFALNGDHWESHTGSFGDKWEDIFGSMAKPSSFVYEMTADINGRDFPKNLKTTTQEYIEYDFGRDNEVFRISNNMYHVLLYYNFEYQETHINKQATLSLGTPSDVIPHLSTISQSMLQ